MRKTVVTGLLALACAAMASAAYADAIDGNWCSPEGKRQPIKGSEITTPGGVKMQGDYSRHAFSYEPPKEEGGAGGKMLLQLVNEFTVHARADGVSGPMVVWKRCEQTS